MSRSLPPYDKATYAKLRAAFESKNPAPAVDDAGEWQFDGALRLMGGTGRPLTVKTGVQEIMVFFGTDSSGLPDGKLRVTMSCDTQSPDRFFQWAISTFGPDGTMHKSIADNFTPLVGKGRPAGVTNKNAYEKIKADLQSGAGVRPVFCCQPLKRREGDEGAETWSLNFTMYLCEETATPRLAGELPPDVESAFKDKLDHPLLVYLRANPTQVISQRLALTVADGVASPAEILAAISHKGKNGYYGKFCGSATIGGIHNRMIEARKLLVNRMYANDEGLRVFAVPNQSMAAPVVTRAADTEVYDEIMGGSTKRGIEDVYEEVLEPPDKTAKTE